MLRLVIWVLVLANAGYFAWTQGYLAALGWAPTVQAEPGRLQAQLRPESLRLLNGPKQVTPATPEPVVAAPAPLAATAAAPPEAATSNPAVPEVPRTACWQAGAYTPTQAESLRSALGQLDLPLSSWQLVEVPIGGRWVVYMGRYNAEQVARKKTELRQLNVAFREVSVPAIGPGLALGTYSSEASAQQALQDMIRKGVRSARVAQERAESISLNLRLPAVTDAQRAAVAGLGATALAGKSLQPCN